MGITSLKSTLTRLFNKRSTVGKRRPQNGEVKSFRENQQVEEAVDRRDLGLRAIPLQKIVGSVGRYRDFDSQFRFKKKSTSERYQWIQNAMRGGLALKPVELFEIKDEYYVLDGNHRIAAAKEMGHDEILAHIMEFIPSKNTLQNLLYRERAVFADRTQLPVEINLTEVSQYAYLLDQISEHQQYLQGQKGKIFSFTGEVHQIRFRFRSEFRRSSVCLFRILSKKR